MRGDGERARERERERARERERERGIHTYIYIYIIHADTKTQEREDANIYMRGRERCRSRVAVIFGKQTLYLGLWLRRIMKLRCDGPETYNSGVVQWLACWAHNPKVRGSKPRSARQQHSFSTATPPCYRPALSAFRRPRTGRARLHQPPPNPPHPIAHGRITSLLETGLEPAISSLGGRRLIH
jgi:hypothetical protein